MAKGSPTYLVRPTGSEAKAKCYVTLVNAVSPTNTAVQNSDYIDAFWYNQATLLINYTKGTTDSLDIIPQFSTVEEPSLDANWRNMPVIGTSATSGGTTTRTINFLQDRRTHSGTVAADIDAYFLEYPINTRYFRFQYRFNGTLVGDPPVFTTRPTLTVVVVFGWA